MNQSKFDDLMLQRMRRMEPCSATGRTTCLLERAVAIASQGTVDREPERWRYVWAWFLARVSFGLFDYHNYLEKFTVRRKWDVFFIMNTMKQLHYVQEILKEILVDSQGALALFKDNGHSVSFENFFGGGTLYLVPFSEQILRKAVGRNFYPIFDHYTVECRMHNGTKKDLELFQLLEDRKTIALNTACVNSQN